MEFRSYSTIELVQNCGSDRTIAEAAWVSTDAQKDDDESVRSLIRYLMKHRHGTPFEHNIMTFRVHAPIFVWREWHRHRIGVSYNEESGRYKKLEPVFYIPPHHRPMFKIDDWKPGRPKFLGIEDRPDGDRDYSTLINNLREVYVHAYSRYEENLAMGFDPGLARDCLPVGIFSTCWVTLNARSLMAFLSLRTHDPDAKFVSYPLYEIEQCAQRIEVIFGRCFPHTYVAFCDNGRVAP